MRLDGGLTIAGLLEALARLEEVGGNIRPTDIDCEPVDHAARLHDRSAGLPERGALAQAPLRLSVGGESEFAEGLSVAAGTLVLSER